MATSRRARLALLAAAGARRAAVSPRLRFSYRRLLVRPRSTSPHCAAAAATAVAVLGAPPAAAQLQPFMRTAVQESLSNCSSQPGQFPNNNTASGTSAQCVPIDPGTLSFCSNVAYTACMRTLDPIAYDAQISTARSPPPPTHPPHTRKVALAAAPSRRTLPLASARGRRRGRPHPRTAGVPDARLAVGDPGVGHL